MTNATKKALAYAIGMIQSMPSYRQDDDALHDMRTDLLNEISATDLAEIVTDVELRSGKAVHLYRDYMDSSDPADVLFKATYDRARGLAYAELIQWREQSVPIGKSPDPAVMAKRAKVCLDDDINLRAAVSAHVKAVAALEKLTAALVTSEEAINAAAPSQPVEDEPDFDEVPLAELTDFDDLPNNGITH